MNLYEDIVKMNVITHPYSLLMIRNEAAKFLLRYDDRWDCWLLPYYKTTSDDVEHLRQCLVNDLSFVAERIERKERKIHEKYSPSNDVNKVYDHTFYYAQGSLHPCHQKEEFVLGGIKYKWFSITDMLNDQNIMRYNSDVVSVLQTLLF